MNNINHQLENSMTSLSGNESHRSSRGSINKSFKPYNNFITIDKRLYGKLINFLKVLIANSSSYKDIIKLDEFIQTEDNAGSNSTESVNDLEEKVSNLNKECQNYQKIILEKANDNNQLLHEMEKLNNLIKELKATIDANNKDITQLKDLIEEKDSLLKEMESKKTQVIPPLIMNGPYTNEESTCNMINIVPADNSFAQCFSNKKILENVLNFLQPKEKLSFALSSSIVKRDLSQLSRIYKDIIQSKNEEIQRLHNINLNKVYEITEPEIERLVREYIVNNRIPGKDLKSYLGKALFFLDKDVKGPLGIGSNAKQDRKDSLFGKINNILNRIVNKEKIKSNTYSADKSEVVSISETDKQIINEHLANTELHLDFDYNHPDEIKELLVQFFSAKLPGSVISNFISEVLSEFADILYYGNQTLLEIKELDIVKNALHERFKKYQKIAMELEAEIDDLKKFAKTNKEIKEILLVQKNEVEVKYTDAQSNIISLKEELNKTTNRLLQATERYNKIEHEYELFKTKLVKEYKHLKIEYETTSKERDVMRDTLLEFKRYFMKFHLTEDGDVVFVE